MSVTNVDFQALHDHYRSRVLRYVTRLVGETEAEDVTQAVMLKISRALPGFRGDSSVSTWIYRIATNAALDSLRRRSAQPMAESELEAEGDVPPEAQAASAETAAMREEMSACIRGFVERLPQSYRTVMVLSELEGFANEEIAAILEVSLPTVKIRLHRAREKLRRDLQAGCSFYPSEDAGIGCEPKPSATVRLRRRT